MSKQEYPIQHLVKNELEWFNCECGKDKFEVTKEFLEGGEPQLGVIETHFSCECGKSYICEYGDVREVRE